MAAWEPAVLPDLLPLYYRRLFPHGPYGRWLSYGGVEKNYFQRREFSFTLRSDVYLRYQSFSSPQELEKEMQKISPYKIDIGAVYSHRPSQRNAVHMGAFQAQEKELVFDIDMTDYDDVRRCCSSAEICSKCWTLMTIAIRIIDRGLVEDFGVKHRLWVYSGRRGVHCWVCDDAVRKWSSALRSAVVEYLSLVKGGPETVKKVNLTEPIHPFISNSLRLVEPYFEEYALVGQDILGSRESWEKVAALVPEPLRESLLLEFPKKHDSVQRWAVLKSKVEKHKPKLHTVKEIVLQYCFPRLDVNVSKGVSHLLKSPFSVHPKTGHAALIKGWGLQVMHPLGRIKISASASPSSLQTRLGSDFAARYSSGLCGGESWPPSIPSSREVTGSSCRLNQVSKGQSRPQPALLVGFRSPSICRGWISSTRSLFQPSAPCATNWTPLTRRMERRKTRRNQGPSDGPGTTRKPAWLPTCESSRSSSRRWTSPAKESGLREATYKEISEDGSPSSGDIHICYSWPAVERAVMGTEGCSSCLILPGIKDFSQQDRKPVWSCLQEGENLNGRFWSYCEQMTP
ncbi:DNA primase small subunit isoform X1 [Carettochelys insculpta]|uniref:DNA primase small subunit isoform X1 n=1 Tax=Carettochelys insculpta TaxID=44489 RepID=UPI003EBB3390